MVLWHVHLEDRKLQVCANTISQTSWLGHVSGELVIYGPSSCNYFPNTETKCAYINRLRLTTQSLPDSAVALFTRSQATYRSLSDASRCRWGPIMASMVSGIWLASFVL